MHNQTNVAKSLLTIALSVCILSQSLVAQDNTRMLVYRASHVPATDLAESVRAMLTKDTSVKVVATPISNALALRGDSQSIDQLLTVLEQLDRRQEMIRLHLFLMSIPDSSKIAATTFHGPLDKIAKEIKSLSEKNKLEVVTEVQLVSLDRQPAFVKIGEKKPAVTGEIVTRGQSMPRYTKEDVGTIVGFTSNVGSDGGISLELNWEKSDVVHNSDGKTPPSITESTTQSTLVLEDRQAQTVHLFHDSAHSGNRILVVGVEILKK